DDAVPVEKKRGAAYDRRQFRARQRERLRNADVDKISDAALGDEPTFGGEKGKEQRFERRRSFRKRIDRVAPQEIDAAVDRTRAGFLWRDRLASAPYARAFQLDRAVTRRIVQFA